MPESSLIVQSLKSLAQKTGSRGRLSVISTRSRRDAESANGQKLAAADWIDISEDGVSRYFVAAPENTARFIEQLQQSHEDLT